MICQAYYVMMSSPLSRTSGSLSRAPPPRSGGLTYSDCLNLARQANSFLLKGIPGEWGIRPFYSPCTRPHVFPSELRPAGILKGLPCPMVHGLPMGILKGLYPIGLVHWPAAPLDHHYKVGVPSLPLPPESIRVPSSSTPPILPSRVQ